MEPCARFTSILSSSLLQYLKDSEGPLSRIIPLSTNRSVEKVVDVHVEFGSVSTTGDDYKAGHYNHYSAKDEGTIGNYAIQHGTTAAVIHFKPQYQSPKWSTVNDWRKSLITKTTQNR